MCGIVGLLLKEKSLRPRLGEFMVPMLIGITERGPDSSGMAVFTDPVDAHSRKLSLYCAQPGFDWRQLKEALSGQLGKAQLEVKANHCIATIGADPATVREWLAKEYPAVRVLSVGRNIDLYKDVGLPSEVADRYGFSRFSGTHLVGHTRMATESAVTPSGAHPYAVGPEQCLVHNGSFANHATIRRELQAAGVRFDSENDTEVGARFVASKLAEGRDVETALKELCATFDGFYTLLVSNRDSFAVVRDAIACKPAVIAETADWVAMGSEYRALSGLPGVEKAVIWEPEPEVVYAWTR
jgi:glutamate synthase domain-containing protein 1